MHSTALAPCIALVNEFLKTTKRRRDGFDKQQSKDSSMRSTTSASCIALEKEFPWTSKRLCSGFAKQQTKDTSKRSVNLVTCIARVTRPPKTSKRRRGGFGTQHTTGALIRPRVPSCNQLTCGFAYGTRYRHLYYITEFRFIMNCPMCLRLYLYTHMDGP
jgi:hypothetical protein